MPVEKTLARLQQMVRRPPKSDVPPGMVFNLPKDLATDTLKSIVLDQAEVDLLYEAVADLEEDLRFEHLEDPKDKLLRLVAQALIDRRTNHVPTFVSEYAQPVEETTCVFAVLHLHVPERYVIGDALLLPSGDELIPAAPKLMEADCSAFLMLPCRGTNYKKMALRARKDAHHAVALLRAGLRLQNVYHHTQLRFRLGEAYAFSERLAGWRRREDVAHDTPVNQEMLGRVQALRFLRLPATPTTDIQRRAVLALDWIDRSLVTPDQLISMLYQFFALEAMLGDRAEGLKSMNLAFRRTMLGHVVTGWWVAPEYIYLLYNDVRSAAVHGSPAPEVSDRDAATFENDVIRALDEYLTFAETNGLTKRSKVLNALMTHKDAGPILQQLQQADRCWEGFELAPG